MPPFEEMDREDKAVYWELIRHDQAGQPIVAAPEELDVRWVATAYDIVDRSGNPVAVEAELLVDTDMVIDSIVWRGELNNWDAHAGYQLMQVKGFKDVPSLNARVRQRIALLSAYAKSLPKVG